MQPRALRAWVAVHSWSSLITTVFLIVVFASGLPLIFKSELEPLLGYGASARGTVSSTEASLENVEAAGERRFPGNVVQYMVWGEGPPNTVLLSMAKSYTAHYSDNFNVLVDASSGELADPDPSPLEFFVTLHTTLLIGPLGPTILGVIALLFVVSLVSGFVVYAPHMRRLRFGDVRAGSSKRVRWLDFHNLVGAVTLGWALVVGGTGMINSWGEYITLSWRAGQLADTVASYEDVPPPDPSEFVSLDRVRDAAEAVAPGKEIYYIASPGTFMSSLHHYSVFMKGATARTEFLLQPVLVDAKTGEITAAPELPHYISALLLAQPLHFGNYGGLPLKIIWATFDLATLALLITGIHLWLARRRGGVGERSSSAATAGGASAPATRSRG